MNSYDVLIIGAGPAGSRVAYKMAESGYKVAVFDKHQNGAGKVCCTGIIGKECLELFDIDSGSVLREVKSAKLFAPSGEFLRVSKGEVQAYIVDRAAFDRSLAEKAKARGVVYFLNSYVSDISVAEDGVEVCIGGVDFGAKAAVIANGFASRLPHKLGLGRIRDFIVGAQTEVEVYGVDEVEVYFSRKIAPQFFAWVVPVAQSRALVGLFAPERPGAYLREFIARLASEGKVSDAGFKISYGGIPLRPLPKTYGDRVLVVGDAAGQVKPTTGGGIYYGLLSADIASEALHQAFLTNDFSKRRLALYEKLWKKKLGRELKIDYFARRLYNRLSDKQIDKIFNIVRDNKIHETMLNSSHMSFDWHGEMVLDGLKHLAPWRHLFGKYIPAYLVRSLRGKP